MVYNYLVILILVGVSVMNTGYYMYRSCCSNKLDPPPFFKRDFYFLTVFMCWKIGSSFICYSNVSFQGDLVFQKLASLVFSTCTTCKGYTPIKDFSQFANAQSSAATKPDQPELPPVVDV